MPGTLANSIQQLGSGIDIYTLNPLATDAVQRTRGVLAQKIVNIDYFEDGTACVAGDSVPLDIATFAEPDGVDITNQPGCSTDVAAEEINSIQEYTEVR